MDEPTRMGAGHPPWEAHPHWEGACVTETTRSTAELTRNPLTQTQKLLNLGPRGQSGGRTKPPLPQLRLC